MYIYTCVCITNIIIVITITVVIIIIASEGALPYQAGGYPLQPTENNLCLQNKRPLQNHAPRLSNPFPPKFNVAGMTIVSGSACKINAQFRKIGSALSFQL